MFNLRYDSIPDVDFVGGSEGDAVDGTLYGFALLLASVYMIQYTTGRSGICS
jgi:hypothetical protein